MCDFAFYMLQVAVVMTILFVVYKIILASTTFFTMNRWVIISIYLMSFIVPALLSFPFITHTFSDSVTVEIPILSEISVNLNSDIYDRAFNFRQFFTLLYLGGAIVASLFTMIGVVRLSRMIKIGAWETVDQIIVVTSEIAPAPFSWGNYVVVRQADHDSDFDMVIEHEKIHIRNKHWIDLAFAQMVVVFQWFSPVAWLLMRELKNVHEYQVDAEMTKHDPYRYQMMLINKTIGSNVPPFTDSLNYGQTKARINMMLTRRSNPLRRLGALSLIPSVALAVFILTQTSMASIKEPSNASSFFSNYLTGDRQVNEAEIMPAYKGGIDSFFRFVIENVKFPNDFDSISDETLVRKVTVQFTVDTDGNTINVQAIGSQNDLFANEAVRVVKLTSGNWIPPLKNGKPVSCTLSVPLTFKQI